MRSSKNRSYQTPEESSSILSGVFILTLSTLIVKVIGLLFKIPVSYLLLDEGMGYFNAAYTVYTWLYTLSTAGIPTAVAILVARNRAVGKIRYAARIVRVTMSVMLIVGSVGTVTLLFGSTFIGRFIGSPDARYAIAAIAPTLLFVGISSVLRGKFQGYGRMGPTALSQLLEALGKLFPGLLFAFFAVRHGFAPPVVAAVTICGISVGSLLGFLALLLFRSRETADPVAPAVPRHADETERPLHDLLVIALPITLSVSVMSLTNLIDLGIIMRRLQAIGYTEAEATALYGNYTTLVVPLFNFPVLFLYPVTAALIPGITRAVASSDRIRSRESSVLALRFATLIGFPCAAGLSVFSRPILRSIYAASSADLAAPYLSALAPGLIFLSLLTITNALLQAHGKQFHSLVSMTIGALIKFCVSYFLLGHPSVALYGTVVGTLTGYFISSLINLIFLHKESGIFPSFSKWLLAPMTATLLSVGTAFVLFTFLHEWMTVRLLVALCISIAACLYYLFSIVFGSLDPGELFEKGKLFHKKAV